MMHVAAIALLLSAIGLGVADEIAESCGFVLLQHTIAVLAPILTLTAFALGTLGTWWYMESDPRTPEEEQRKQRDQRAIVVALLPGVVGVMFLSKSTSLQVLLASAVATIGLAALWVVSSELLARRTRLLDVWAPVIESHLSIRRITIQLGSRIVLVLVVLLLTGLPIVIEALQGGMLSKKLLDRLWSVVGFIFLWLLFAWLTMRRERQAVRRELELAKAFQGAPLDRPDQPSPVVVADGAEA